MTVLELVQHRGLVPVRKSSRECCSPCPGCGGDDRFVIKTDEDRYFCRRCGKRGDAIQFLRDFEGKSFPDACKALGIEPGEAPRKYYPPARRVERPAWTPKKTEYPGEVWEEKARAFSEWAAGNLEGDQGREAVAYLEARGLTPVTIRDNRLGLNPKGLWREREAWGLPAEIREDGTPKRLWLPAGIVIPNDLGGRLLGVKIRRPDADVERDRERNPDREPSRYIAVSGGSGAPMVLLGGPSVLVVEAELDALLVNQEAGDLVSAVALGSCSTRPDQATTGLLTAAESILVALDADPAGAEQVRKWWRENFPQARRLPPVGGKDPGDMIQAGESILYWVMAGIQVGGRIQERPNTTDKGRK